MMYSVEEKNTPEMTHKTKTYVSEFLCDSYKPVRLIFSKDVYKYGVNYQNAIFEYCINLHANKMYFKKGPIEIPATIISKYLSDPVTELKFEDYDEDHYVVDTEGKIPIRYIFMLKDFYFKNRGTIDYNSKVDYMVSKKTWTERVDLCHIDILKRFVRSGLDVAEDTQNYQIHVVSAPPYTSNRVWSTENHHWSPAAKEFINRSSSLYSLGNDISTNKYRYHVLFAAEGGIHMEYAKYLPWYKLRNFFRWYSGGRIDTRGVDTYRQRRDLSVEEIVILHEFLKSEGADVKVIAINGSGSKL
jgi:hypothetical protein